MGAGGGGGGGVNNWMGGQMGGTTQNMGNGNGVGNTMGGSHGNQNYNLGGGGGGGSFQQANQMANRLQQMAMEEHGVRGGGRRHDDFQSGYEEGPEYVGGGMKRQMNSQGGNRGKKNRGGCNR